MKLETVCYVPVSLQDRWEDVSNGRCIIYGARQNRKKKNYDGKNLESNAVLGLDLLPPIMYIIGIILKSYATMLDGKAHYKQVAHFIFSNRRTLFYLLLFQME